MTVDIFPILTVDIFPIFEDDESGDAVFQSLGYNALEYALAAVPQAIEAAREQGAIGIDIQVRL